MRATAVLLTLILASFALSQRVIQPHKGYPNEGGFGDFASAKNQWRECGSAVVLIPFPKLYRSGAGFLVAKDTIVTAAHVIQGKHVDVYFKDKAKRAASVWKKDDDNDLAILKIDPVSVTPLAFAADADVGDMVFTIGHPYGYQWSLTHGILSAEKREITMPNGVTIADLWQTDVPINGGNSGGPLLDKAGKVVGMMVALRDGSNGIAFALSSRVIRNALK